MKITGVHIWRGKSTSISRTLAIGRAIGKLVRAADTIALHGELGAGKTQVVRGIAEGLGISANVASPTYVLMQEYPAKERGLVLVHIDAYRMREASDLESIGWGPPGRSDLR